MDISNINQTIQLFLRKTFDIREGELERSLLMQGNIFLIITTLLMVKPTVNSLFLTKFGVENLPYAFILVAIVAAVVSTLYSKLLQRISLNRLMIGTLYASIFSLIIFGLFLVFNIAVEFVLYLFYIWVAIFALLTTSQFWVMANIVFNAREAKRLFGFIGAGAIAGGILGGYLTSVLAQLISSQYLPFICALFLAICVPVTRRIWKKEVSKKQTIFQQKKKIKGIPDHPFKMILQSRHLTYIACIVGVSAIVAKLVDYQFGGIASALIPDEDELTAFFGFWFSTFNVISLLTQLFVTRRIVGTYGVGYSLLFLPGSILLAATLLLFMPELLLAAVFLKMSDGGLKQSVNKSAMELLVMPIPQDIKNQTKTFIDVFVDSLATGLSGLMLIFLVKGLNLSTTAISLLIIGFIFIWLYLAYKVRGAYFNSFRQKINFTKDKTKSALNLRKESVIGGMKKVLEKGSEQQVLFILQKIKENPDSRFLDAIKNLIQHPNDDIRAEAIHNLYFYKSENLLEQIEPLSGDASQKVKIAVFDYLLAHVTEKRVDIINSYLFHESYKIRYAALVSLAKETRNNPKLKSLFQLETLIRNRIEHLTEISDAQQRKFYTIGLLKAIGYSGSARLYFFINEKFKSTDKDILLQAIKSAGDTLHPQFIDALILFLANPKLRNQARLALLHFGKSILNILVTTYEEEGTRLDIKRSIPSVVKYISAQKAVEFLFSLLDAPDRVIKQEALRGLNHLKNNFPHLTFSKKTVVQRILNEVKLYQETLVVLYAQVTPSLDLSIPQEPTKQKNLREAQQRLIGLLEKRLDKNLERIFRLLGLKYASTDVLSIYRGLHNTKEDIRLNAIEFLDNLLEPSLKKTLIPLIETSMLETITEAAIKQLNVKIPGEKECLSLLLNNHDLKIKHAVLYLIRQLNDPEYISILEVAKVATSGRFVVAIDEVLDHLKKE